MTCVNNAFERQPPVLCRNRVDFTTILIVVLQLLLLSAFTTLLLFERELIGIKYAIFVQRCKLHALDMQSRHGSDLSGNAACASHAHDVVITRLSNGA